MKKLLIIVCTLLLSFQMMVLNVFASQDMIGKPKPVTVESTLLGKNNKTSRVSEYTSKRGDFFMGADLVISDEGSGNVGAVAIAYLAVPAEEVYISIYLDQYDEKADAWRQVAYHDAEFYAGDYPEGLNDPSVNITFQKVPKGHYYRLRGAFSAVKDNKFEGFSPVTDGIWIE